MATPISKSSLSPITAKIWQFPSPSFCPPWNMIVSSLPPPSFPYSLSRSVFFFISYHTHHSVSLLPGSYSVILIITTVQEDNIYIQFRLFLIRKKVGARLGRVQFKPKYWQVKDTFSFLTDPNLNPHVPVLVSAKVLSHPRNTRWKKKSRIG